MDKQTVLQKIKDVGIVAVVRATSADEAKKITEACMEGGVPAIELTFTVPGAHKVIDELASYYKNDNTVLLKAAGNTDLYPDIVLDLEKDRFIAIGKVVHCTNYFGKNK